MNESKPLPTLYIIMRTDMASMNPGKGMAQAAHAANAFDTEIQAIWSIMENGGSPSDNDVIAYDDFREWVSESNNNDFGVTIVLGADEKEMKRVVNIASREGKVAGVVHDPSYPLRDGDTTHLIPVDTCAYVFADRSDVNSATMLALRNLNLHA